MDVERVWQQQCEWSALASARRHALRRSQLASSVLVILGAEIAAFAAALEWSPYSATGALGLAAAVALLLAALTGRFDSPTRIREQAIARTAAEALKSAVHRYRAVPADARDHDAELRDVERRIADQAGFLGVTVADLRPRAHVHAAPLPAPGVDAYVENRVRPQIAWHETRSRHHAARQRRWQYMEITAITVAILLAVVGATVLGTGLSALVGVATTVAATVAAHQERQNNAQNARLYALTADNLEELLRNFDPASADPAAAAAFVERVEHELTTQGWA